MRIFRQGNDLLVLMAVPGARDTEVQVEIARGALVVRVQPGGGARVGCPGGESRFFRRLELPFTPRPQDVTAWIFKGGLLVRIAMPHLRDWERYAPRRQRPPQGGRRATDVASGEVATRRAVPTGRRHRRMRY
jgi:hypothetical protein